MEPTREQQIVGQVLEKAWNDPNFKAELIAAPMQAIKEATGETLDLPKGVKMEVHDQSDTSIAYLVIPPKPDLDNLELTDEQLEMVAGGVVITTAVLTWTISGAIVSIVSALIITK